MSGRRDRAASFDVGQKRERYAFRCLAKGRAQRVPMSVRRESAASFDVCHGESATSFDVWRMGESTSFDVWQMGERYEFRFLADGRAIRVYMSGRWESASSFDVWQKGNLVNEYYNVSTETI